MRKVLIINGHPGKRRFSNYLIKKYSEGAKESNAKIKTLHINKLEFDPILHEGYKKEQDLEKDLRKSQELVNWAEHLVFIYPTWWGGMPALMKGWIDRVFLPGFAFKFKKNSNFPEGYLKKTSRIITTSGGKKFLYSLIGFPSKKEIKIMIMKFCGIKSRYTLYGSIHNPIPKKRLERLGKKVKKLGKKLK